MPDLARLFNSGNTLGKGMQDSSPHFLVRDPEALPNSQPDCRETLSLLYILPAASVSKTGLPSEEALIKPSNQDSLSAYRKINKNSFVATQRSLGPLLYDCGALTEPP